MAVDTRIERLTLHRLTLPLTVPYRLSLGELRAFDVLLVVALGSDGRQGLGEATYVSGYTHETMEEGWRLAAGLAEVVVGLDCAAAQARLVHLHGEAPFTATALTTAVEMVAGTPLLDVTGETRVPILAIVNAARDEEIEREVSDLIARGHTTLKVKVGFDPDSDLARVRRIQQAARGRATLRLDANQGYERDDACRFAAALEPEGIELLEQPCAAGDWDAAVAVARVSTVPTMLDESIYGLEDIERAAELRAARLIKFKLMKAGGLQMLADALGRIRALGMEPVLGNGVAAEVSCWMEALVARGRIANAGEMNGFLKPRERLFRRPLRFDGGAIVLEPGFVPELDPDVLARTGGETFAVPEESAPWPERRSLQV